MLELVITLVIIGTLAAIAMPRYGRSVERFRADAAARRVIADLAYAQSQARTTGVSKTVSFDAVQDRYDLLGVDDLDHAGTTYAVELGAAPYEADLVSAQLDDADTPDDATFEVIFDAYGMPDSGGQIVVRAGNVSRTITVGAATGKAVAD